MTARSDVLFITDKTKLKSAWGSKADFTGMAASGTKRPFIGKRHPVTYIPATYKE
jgi:hypothetical protein